MALSNELREALARRRPSRNRGAPASDRKAAAASDAFQCNVGVDDRGADERLLLPPGDDPDANSAPPARGFFVDTVGRDTETIRKYIAEQEMEDRRLDQLEMPEITRE